MKQVTNILSNKNQIPTSTDRRPRNPTLQEGKGHFLLSDPQLSLNSPTALSFCQIKIEDEEIKGLNQRESEKLSISIHSFP